MPLSMRIECSSSSFAVRTNLVSAEDGRPARQASRGCGVGSPCRRTWTWECLTRDGWSGIKWS